MRHVPCRERPDWKETAQQFGFRFYLNYWEENRYYEFSRREIDEKILPAAQSLNDICMEFVDRAVDDEKILTKLRIPEWFWGKIKESWQARSPALMGRFDFIYDGTGAPKMMEYNADTPGMIYESSFFQLQWLEQAAAAGIIPANSDQFNNMQGGILSFFEKLKSRGKLLHFSCIADMEEDYENLQYLVNCASHVGCETKLAYLEEIKFDDDRSFRDAENRKVDVLFKYYPWEWMLAEDPGIEIPKTDILYIEPEWKLILSNKASLPYLWKFHRGHPNLLPCYFAEDREKPDLSSNFVIKPIFSREGSNVTIVEDGKEVAKSEGPYGIDGYVMQEYVKLKEYPGGRFTTLGAWIIDGQAAGLALRESTGRITGNTAYFAPHIVTEGGGE